MENHHIPDVMQLTQDLFPSPVCTDSEPYWSDAVFDPKGHKTKTVKLIIDSQTIKTPVIFKMDHGAETGLVMYDGFPFAVTADTRDTYIINRLSFVPLELFTTNNVSIPSIQLSPKLNAFFNEKLFEVFDTDDIDHIKNLYGAYQTGRLSLDIEDIHPFTTPHFIIKSELKNLTALITAKKIDIAKITDSYTKINELIPDELMIEDAHYYMMLYKYSSQLNKAILETSQAKSSHRLDLVNLSSKLNTILFRNLENQLVNSASPGYFIKSIVTYNLDYNAAVSEPELSSILESNLDLHTTIRFFYLLNKINILSKNITDPAGLNDTLLDFHTHIPNFLENIHFKNILNVTWKYVSSNQDLSDVAYIFSGLIKALIKNGLSTETKYKEVIGEVYIYGYENNIPFLNNYLQNLIEANKVEKNLDILESTIGHINHNVNRAIRHCQNTHKRAGFFFNSVYLEVDENSDPTEIVDEYLTRNKIREDL